MIHATKYLTIKNLTTGQVENIRSSHNYWKGSDKDKATQEKRIKKEFESASTYKVLSCRLSA